MPNSFSEWLRGCAAARRKRRGCQLALRWGRLCNEACRSTRALTLAIDLREVCPAKLVVKSAAHPQVADELCALLWARLEEAEAREGPAEVVASGGENIIRGGCSGIG